MSNHHQIRTRIVTRAALLALALAATGVSGHASAQEEEDDSAASAPNPTGLVVDIASATPEQLMELPGIGPSKAAAIVEYRTRTPFRRVEDLMRVRGIGRATFRRLRSMISVGATAEAGEARRARAHAGRPGQR